MNTNNCPYTYKKPHPVCYLLKIFINFLGKFSMIKNSNKPKIPLSR